MVEAIKKISFSGLFFCRYPYDDAATVAVSTIKDFANDFKEVSTLKNNNNKVLSLFVVASWKDASRMKFDQKF